jgi:hypothetical protein
MTQPMYRPFVPNEEAIAKALTPLTSFIAGLLL